jgi:hypothetical protein
MKESPQTKRLEEILSSSKMVAGGFLGYDPRSLSEIIDSDLTRIARSGFTIEQITSRMKEITSQAISFLGNWTEIDKKRMVKVDEAKGWLVCPWPHTGRFAKRVTYVKSVETGQIIKWSDLNIHLIEKHAFFEGKGSSFRIEPNELVKMIF